MGHRGKFQDSRARFRRCAEKNSMEVHFSSGSLPSNLAGAALEDEEEAYWTDGSWTFGIVLSA